MPDVAVAVVVVLLLLLPHASFTAQQVHLAKIKGGEQVAVKVQRAGLKALFDQDLKVNDNSKNSDDSERDKHGAGMSAKTQMSIGLGKKIGEHAKVAVGHNTVRSNGHIHARGLGIADFFKLLTHCHNLD